MTRALILAAGFGSRLGALSDERPKPLLPVCDQPLIRYAVALLVGHGIRDIAINLHWKGELIEQALGDGSTLGARIRYSHEAEILGTGGGIRRIADWLTDGGRDSFFVVNGKILIDVDLHAVAARHARTGAAATMVVRPAADAARWGAIHVDATDPDGGPVTGILDSGRPGTHACMFTGVHLLSPRLVERLPAEGESDSIRHAYLPALREGDRLEGHLLHGFFHEHSTPQRYLEGNWMALDRRARVPYPPGALDGVDATAQVHPSARLVAPYRIGPEATVGAGATVGPYAVVGSGATVEEGSSLDHAVLWPGSRARGTIRHAIVTPKGVLSVEEG
jgi:NDP-sugar pyrophosphorylase family protein